MTSSSLITTKKILLEINNEVLETVKEIAKEKSLNIVFNDSVPNHKIFPDSYNDRSVFRNFGASSGNNAYYDFLSDSIRASKKGATPASINLSSWLEHSRDPKVIDSLPMNSQSFVINGAEDILLEVIKRIYSKYNIKEDIYKNIELALKEIKSDKLWK